MRYRQLGETDLKVSEIGFGCWGIGGDSYGETSDLTSVRAIEAALDKGINFFDTSDFYGAGRSESVLGRAIHSRRDQAIVATKVGMLSATAQDFSVNHIKRTLDASLKRLQLEVIDLYQLHNPTPALIESHPEIISTLDECKKAGKIRHYGVSAQSPQDAAAFIENCSFSSVQVNFNLIDQRCVELDLFKKAKNQRVGIIARTPLCFGFLTGGYGQVQFGESDHRKRWSSDQKEVWSKAIEKFLSFKTGLKEETNAHFAIRFCLSFPEVTATIPGMLTEDHVQENARAIEFPLFSVEERQSLFRVYKENSFKV
jgi:aryl-alcohol dehydrogenase-like predicted oxidoreductase